MDNNQNTQNTTDRQKYVLTVTQLNNYIKSILDNTKVLTSVFIKGEISNFTNHYKTGHLYFTLKDEGGLIRAVMFKGAAQKLKFMPADGMKVIAHGRLSMYVKDGQCMYYADSLEPDGVGALYVAFEQLKAKLGAEGLFSEARKRPLPKIPKRVGIITSPTGAAVRDMINIMGRRFPFAELVLFPALVQGDGAAAQLIEGIQYFNSQRNADVIIIGRGGGSIEDLWAFNDENLARAVAASQIPVISAVGHETDFTICDFAADKRAPTPSAAAELAVPETQELKRKFTNLENRLELLTSKSIEFKRQRFERAAQSRALNMPELVIDDRRLMILNEERRLESAMKLLINARRSQYTANTAKLEALNPMAVISRGYSAVYTDDKKLIKSVDQVEIGDSFSFKTKDGEVAGKVTEKRKYQDD
nr:exodeoxyribonuclease VII large subunit [Clostridia bacterium]